MSKQGPSCRKPLPAWLRRPPGSASETREVKRLLRTVQLNTVCEEARCPNIAECFSRKTLTFLLLGDRCTRGCRFCSVDRFASSSAPRAPIDCEREAQAVAQAAEQLALQYVVLTSVTRDDLPDGGASGFAAAIAAVRASLPQTSVEVLVPDFRGEEGALRTVLKAKPDVFGHNLETIARLYPALRPEASYDRSLALLARAKQINPEILTKTGIMLGLGEAPEEVLELMADARRAEVDIFSAGQYLQPKADCAPVIEYVNEEQFVFYRQKAAEMGFSFAACAPLVRSSYRADEGPRPRGASRAAA